MDSASWQKIETLVEEALAIPERERAAWLDANCNGDDFLRAEVISLLAFESQAESFLHKPAVAKAALLLTEEDDRLSRKGQHIGPYKFLSEIGRGGMGVVYLAAREDDQFRQRVAIKLIKRGFDTEDILRRFRNERQILASLNHSNIARLFDGGTTGDGLPYFVMEYVEGLPLLQYCDEHELSTNERLKLFLTICSAVQHAHQNLVIHRDLKPSNIMVTHEGDPKLLDFGVAKFLNPELIGESAEQTQTMLRVMTPEYASPEQVRGQHVTTSTDVYSLGIILYELLTGIRPYKLKDTSPEELSRAIRESEPTKPSDAFRDTGTGRRRDTERRSSPNIAVSPRLRVSASQLRGDLDNIVLMAIRKEPGRRYKSIEQFSEDIERHLKGLPVIARKDTFAYRTSKLAQRHKAAAAAAVLVALAIIAGLIATTWQARRASEQARVAEEQRDKAQAAQARTEKINAFMQSIFSYANPHWFGRAGGRKDVSVLEAMRDIEKHIDTDFQDEPDLRADVYQQLGDSYRTQGLFADAERNLREALRLRLELYGEDNAKVAESLYILSGVLCSQGNEADWERLLTQALAVQRRHPHDGNNLPHMIVDYGVIISGKGDFAAGLALHHEALEDFRKRYGESHYMICETQTLIAGDYFQLGDYPQAEAYAQESFKSAHSSGFSDLQELPARSALAQSLIIRGDYQAAQNAIEQLLSESRGKYEEARYVIVAEQLQSSAAYHQGNYVQAKTHAENFLSAANSSAWRPGNDFYRYDSKYLLARCLNKLEGTRRAETLIREAIESLKKSPLAENLFLASRLDSVLGESLTAQRRFVEAETLLLKAHEIQRARVLPQESNLIETRGRLAELYRTWGKTEEARQYE